MGITKYPHTCSYATQGTTDVWDEENGGWIPGIPGSTVEVECRVKPSGAGKTVRGQDGVMIDYDYDLSFPMTVEPIPVGTNVTLSKDGTDIFTGPLLDWFQFERHQSARV